MSNYNYTVYQSLLNEIINKTQKKQNKDGSSFNIFNIIGKSSDEVNIHSKFLAELLNPNGSHGCGDNFLKAFLKQLNINDEKFDFSSVRVRAEHDIGPVSKDYCEGGRIDILITFEKPKLVIVIENKIYAGDQEKQLIRYKNYAEKKSHNYKILYLTPNGTPPSKISTQTNPEEESNEKKFWIEISYKDDIKVWLNKWLNIPANQNKTLIWPVIKQYYTLLGEITGDTIEDASSKKIYQSLLKDDNLQLAFDFSKEIDNVKEDIFFTFCNKLYVSLKKDGFKYDYEGSNYDKNYRRFYLKKANWPYSFVIELYLPSPECKFGIIWYEDKGLQKKQRDEIKKKVRELQDYKNKHSWWLIWDYPDEKYAFWDSETFANINKNSKELTKIFKEKIESYTARLDEILEESAHKTSKGSPSERKDSPPSLNGVAKILKKRENLVAAEIICSEIDNVIEKHFDKTIEKHNWQYLKNYKKVYVYYSRYNTKHFEIGFGRDDNPFDSKDTNNFYEKIKELEKPLSNYGKDLKIHKRKNWIYIDFEYKETLNKENLDNLYKKIESALKDLKK